MADQKFCISFADTTVADANHYCEDLRTQLLESDSQIKVARERSDPSTMDFGATLVMVLGAPATVAAARAIVAWAKRNNRASIILTTRDGTVVAKNLESKDVPEIARALSGK
jgi:hypothetical protein